MSKLTDVLTAMREACGSKEQLTAQWLQASSKHRGLHDALKAVFARKPTTQRLGLWLSKHIGATHGELELIGRHSTHSKAWLYAVRDPLLNPFAWQPAPAPGLIREYQPPVTSKPETPKAAPAEIERPATESPKTRVEEMRQRYIEHHKHAVGGVGGNFFADPGGVVSGNINAE
jgi:hypothetical protein